MSKEIEKKIKDIKILKLMIEEQRQTVASTQEVADKEYRKLKQMEKDLLKSIDEQARLEKENKDESNGKWVEFTIDSLGNFFVLYGEPIEKYVGNRCRCYHWLSIADFLMDSAKLGWNYFTFGGWQYENCDTWFMCPMMHQKGLGYYNTDRKKDYIGAVPVKIRFWREEKNSNQTTDNDNNKKKMTDDEIKIYLVNNMKNKIHYNELPESVRSWIQSWPNIKDCYKWNGSLWMSCNDTDFFSEIDPLSIFCLIDNNLKMEAR